MGESSQQSKTKRPAGQRHKGHSRVKWERRKRQYDTRAPLDEGAYDFDANAGRPE